MRHWFLALMIALLPLRGWVADAMAVEMLSMPTHAATAMEEHGAEHGHCACDEHASSAAPDGSNDHTHSACDVCNVPGLALALTLQHTPHTLHSQLSGPTERFASSEARQGSKPPIS